MNAKILLPLVILSGLGLYYYSKEDNSAKLPADTKATKQAKQTRKLTIYRKKLK
ncbi:MAG: hypothetical protein NTW49_08760 [Bacteroidia bacterium]|nr:hypothetical protein [Bacteroidia bacterium]